jgi:hypothetical protein
MKPFGTGILILLILLILSAGCTRSSPAPAARPVATAPALPPATAAPTAETSPAVVITSPPQVIVTLVHYIVPTKAWKDSELHFAFEAPEDWNVTTRLVSLPEGSQGLVYRTELVPDDVFSIVTYPVSLNQDQAYRDTFRTWSPAPVESTVTSHGIILDRFESSLNGTSHVGYVVQKGSASDIGFASVLVYTTDTSRPFDKADFEKVVASFTYFTKDQAANVTGEEIPRVR